MMRSRVGPIPPFLSVRWTPVCLVGTALLLGGRFASAEDWPQFRGPAGQGCSQEKSLPVHWDTDSKNVRWKTPIPGQGASSPIVSQGRVYVTTAYEGEQRHALDAAAMAFVLGLCLGAAFALVVQLRKAWPWLFPPGPAARWGRVLVAVLTGFTLLLVAASGAILTQPSWFWPLPDTWWGTRTVDPELPWVESLHLGSVFGWCAGALLVVFAVLILDAAAQAVPVGPTKPSPLLARWMAAATACCTLIAVVAAALIVSRPAWFWQSGQPWLAWMVSGGIGLMAVAAGVGWLTDRYAVRVVGCLLGLGAAGWLFGNMPLNEFNHPVDVTIQLAVIAPGSLLLVGQAVVSGLAFTKRWPVPAIGRWLPLLLPALGGVLFWWANYLQPVSGMLRVVVCLDADTGTVLWQTPLFALPTEKKHSLNTYATPTPATDGERVFADFGSGLAALDRDGQVLWRVRDPDYLNYTRYGAGSSPVLGDDLLIVYRDREWLGPSDDSSEGWGDRDSTLIAYDKLTGAERWRATPRFSRDSYMTPLIWSHEGRPEVVVATWRTLAGFDLRTGALRWQYAHPLRQMVPSLVVNGDCLILGGGNYVPHPLLSVCPPRGDQPGRTRWLSKKGGPEMATPVCWEGLLFSVSKNGVLYCRDAAADHVFWDLRLRGRFLASLVAGDGKVYVLNDDGMMFVVAADRKAHLLAENRMDADGICAATPAIADGCLFLRTGQYLVCITGGTE